ncbi:MAG: OmpA family protein [Desulfuromonadia bacterium]
MTNWLVRLSALLGTLIILSFLAGCVSSGTYRQKEQEAAALSRDLDSLNKTHATLKGEHEALLKENEMLKGELARLRGDLSDLRARLDKMSADNRELDSLLKARSDTFSRTVSEQRDRIAALQKQNEELSKGNDDLRREIEAIRRAKDEEVKKTSKTYEDLLASMKQEIAQGQVTISELKGKLTVNMVDAILFDSGKAEVKSGGLDVLQKVVDILKDVKEKSIRIEGHTDNVPIRGGLAQKYPTNWELSAARAINVTRYLQSQGIDPANLSAVAYGEYKPVAPNDTDEGRAKNRRIEIILVPREQ